MSIIRAFMGLSSNLKAIIALAGIAIGGAGWFAVDVATSLPASSAVMAVDNSIDKSLIPDIDQTSDVDSKAITLPIEPLNIDPSSDTAAITPTPVAPVSEPRKQKNVSSKQRPEKKGLPAVVKKVAVTSAGSSDEVFKKPAKKKPTPRKKPKQIKPTNPKTKNVIHKPIDPKDKGRARFNRKRQGFSVVSYSPPGEETPGSFTKKEVVNRNVNDKWDIPGDTNTYPTDLSRVVIKEKFIYATLNNRVVSAFAGRVLLTISQNIYGSHGGKVLIPVGTKASGTYAAVEKIGVERLFVHVERMVTPDGQLILFKKSSTVADQQGATGITGDIDNKYLEKFGLPLAFSVANNTVSLMFQKLATKLTPADAEESDLSKIFSDEWAANQSETNQQIIADIIENNINIMPTITVEPGNQIILYLEHDIFFKPNKNGVTEVVTEGIPRKENSSKKG